VNRELRGKLLIASPQLGDYFHRTVVLVVEHTEEGAMGFPQGLTGDFAAPGHVATPRR